MPKKNKDNSDLRAMRLQERKRNSSELPSHVHLCVLGNGAPGSPRALYMSTTHSKYLFNCGEGTQRLAHEYKMKLSKLDHIFITHKSWNNLGGILGLSLTVQDIGVPQITVHGPPDIENIYSLTKSFVPLKNLAIEKRGMDDSPFVDGCMTVEYIPISNPLSSSVDIEHSESQSDSDLEERKNNAKKKRKVSHGVQTDTVVAYACKGHSKKGRLLHEKCLKLGVPPGPLFGDLKNGKDITLPSGVTVYSKDVVAAEEPCPIFLVVECPSEKFLDSFVSEGRFAAFQTSSESRENAQLVIHFTPASIIDTSLYQTWMHRFPENTYHLILNEKCSTVNSEAIHKIQYMLNLFHPNIFSLLHESELLQESKSLRNVVYAETLCRYHIRPHNGLDNSSCVKIHPEDYVAEALNTPNFENCLQQMKNCMEVHNASSKDDYPELVFLGTGSCIPNKVRNVSCIFLNVSPECSVVLDCGEGSYKQLLRFYGPRVTESILVKISCIFISHMHADHHLGLLTLLKERKLAFETLNKVFYPVVIVAPLDMSYWLSDWNTMFESVSDLYRFIECDDLIFNNISISSDEKKLLSEACKDIRITTVPVIHCKKAFGAVFNLQAVNKTIVYSGDTVPCVRLIEAGKNCDLLIHEATMEDDLKEDALMKKHSTTSQAIEVGEKMNASYIILTHFSQRYAKIPLFNEQFQGHIGFAFDNMKVRLSDLFLIPLFIPSLKILFADHVEKLQEKIIKKKLKEQSQKDCENE